METMIIDIIIFFDWHLSYTTKRFCVFLCVSCFVAEPLRRVALVLRSGVTPRRSILWGNKMLYKENDMSISSAILILLNVQANTRFAPTSDAGFRTTVGANLVFACS